LIYIQNGVLHEIKGTKQPIGGWNEKNQEKNFEKHIINIESTTTFYLCSDGYQDQFGGPRGRKYSSRSLKEALLQFSDLEMTKQQEKLAINFYEWLQNEKQLDDVLIMGVKIEPQ
jgi:hypothetical protein